MNNDSIARNIYRLRKAKAWSQQKLSEVANVSYQTVFRAEAGSMPRIENLRKIAGALGVAESELMTGAVAPSSRSDLITSIVTALPTLNDTELDDVDAFIRATLARRPKASGSVG